MNQENNNTLGSSIKGKYTHQHKYDDAPEYREIRIDLLREPTLP